VIFIFRYYEILHWVTVNYGYHRLLILSKYLIVKTCHQSHIVRYYYEPLETGLRGAEIIGLLDIYTLLGLFIIYSLLGYWILFINKYSRGSLLWLKNLP